MSVPLPAMKTHCSQCRITDIFTPKSDVIHSLPICKKCGHTMSMVGKMTLLDWVKYPIQVLRSL